MHPFLASDPFRCEAILFDKIPDANWNVPWHQDVTIAVQERVEAEGFGTVAPRQLREEKGALRVIPGSHLYGQDT